jgi:hypothetical protein
LKKLLLIFCLFFYSHSTWALPNENLGHLYVAGGEGLISLGSVRLGHKNWELGMVQRGAFALNKLFYKGNTYASFGPALTLGGLGIYGAMGHEIPFWKIFTFRFELNGAQSFSNYGTGGILLGLTLTL